MSLSYMVVWTCMTLIVFTLLIALSLDICLFVAGKQTISSVLQQYFDGGPHSYRAAVFGFIIGALMAHFTGWK